MVATPPTEPIHFFGVALIGATKANLIKVLLTAAWVVGVAAAGRGLRWSARQVITKRYVFWVRQAISILATVLTVAGVLSIWFERPEQLTTAIGLITAGVAFAFQRLLTAVAGYFVILRSGLFKVGDRIVMGGVRGDVMSIHFIQTSLLEIGRAESEADDHGSWIHSRQYTGRVVTVSNAWVFDQPVYNYSKLLAFIWEEMRLNVPYGADPAPYEAILLEAAADHTGDVRDLSHAQRQELAQRYGLEDFSAKPRVYCRLTDAWIELTVRFLSAEHTTRDRKDAMARQILERMTKAGLQVATSGTVSLARASRLSVVIEPPSAAP
jgi:small-conductance mechanosensitive channel